MRWALPIGRVSRRCVNNNKTHSRVKRFLKIILISIFFGKNEEE